MSEPEPYDADAELLEHAAEAMAIIAADDKLKAAWAEVLRARRAEKVAQDLFNGLKREVSAHQRLAAGWKAKARKSALCEACKVNLERDE